MQKMLVLKQYQPHILRIEIKSLIYKPKKKQEAFEDLICLTLKLIF